MREITETKELQSIVFGLLEKIDDFCKSRGIRYSLAGGTLIGAVRHKGFIPWDDDIDIMMPRPDYERFCREFSAPNASVHTFEKDRNYFYPFAKVFDDRTMLVEDRDPKVEAAVGVDVFPIDGLRDGDRDPRSVLRVQHRCYAAMSLRRAPPLFRRRPWKKQVALWVGAPLRLVPSFIRKALCRTMLRRLTRRLKETSFNGASFAGPLTWGNGMKEVHPRADFEIESSFKFEGRLFPAINGWRAYLESDYGDFMTPPSPEKQVTHHDFRAWWKKADGQTNGVHEIGV